jgi:hypothetical protein
MMLLSINIPGSASPLTPNFKVENTFSTVNMKTNNLNEVSPHAVHR